MLYAEVIPSLRLSKKIDFFDYAVPLDMEGGALVGDVVFVEFGKKIVPGIIIKIKNRSDWAENLKPIKEVLNLKISGDIIKTIFWMKDFLFVPTTLGVKTILPSIPRKKQNTREKNFSTKTKTYIFIRDEKISSVAKEIDNSPSLFFNIKWDKTERKNFLIAEVVKNALQKNKKVLILEPRFKNLFLMHNFLKSVFGEKSVGIYHRKLNKNESFDIWQKAARGEKKIIVGTRASVFFPVSDLEYIIFDDEDETDFKSADQNPYYDSRSIALLRSQYGGIKIITLSQTPRLESFLRASKTKNFYNIGGDYSDNSRLIDLKGNFSVISYGLEESVRNALQEEKKVILFLNRKGESTFISCKDCGFVWKCDSCNLPLAVYEKKILCHHCGKTADIPLSCQGCHGANIRFKGIGTQKLEKEIKKIFGEARIFRADKDTGEEFPPEKEREEIKKADIIIGTEYLFKNYLYPYSDILNIGLVAVPVVDALFSLPDFKTDERAFAWIVKLKIFSKSVGADFILQTYSPENPIIHSALRNEPDFYRKELQIRENFHYPPFYILVKIFGDEKIGDDILRAISNFGEVSRGEKIKNKKKEYSLTIKIPSAKHLLIKEIIKTIPDKYKVDINPI